MWFPTRTIVYYLFTKPAPTAISASFDDDAMMTELPKMLKELIELSKQ